MSLLEYKKNTVPISIGSLDGNQLNITASISYNSGWNLAVYEVPFGTRIIQNLGKKERTYLISGISKVFDNGKNIKSQMESILQLDSEIILIDDLGASFNLFVSNVDIKPFSQNMGGVFTYEITAIQSSKSSFKTKPPFTFTVLNNTKQLAKVSTRQKFENFFRARANNISTIRGKISGVLFNITSITTSFNTIATEVSLLTREISQIQSTIGKLLTAPAQLYDAFSTLVDNLSNTFSSLEENIKATLELAYTNDVSLQENTSQLSKTTTDSLNLIDSLILTNVINNYVNQINDKDFVYDFEIKEQYNNIKRLQGIAKNISDIEIRMEIENTLRQILSILNEKNLFTRKKRLYKTTFNTTERLLCYNIYGNLDNLNNIRNWNNLKINGFIKSNTNIVYYE